MATKPRGKRRKAVPTVPPVKDPVVSEPSITLPDPPPVDLEPVVIPDPPEEESADDPPTEPPGKATITGDQIGSAAASASPTAVPPASEKPFAGAAFKGYDDITPVPEPEYEEEDDEDEIQGLLPGTISEVTLIPTPVEPVEETDEVPIVPSPTPHETRHATLVNAIAGPRGTTPRGIDMTNPNPGSPPPPANATTSTSRMTYPAIALGIVVTLAMLVEFNYHNPATPSATTEPAVIATTLPSAEVDPAGPVADAAPSEAPARPAEVPTPPEDAPPAEPTASAPSAAIASNPTTGYEADEPSSATASEGKPVATAPVAAATVAKPTVAKPTVAAVVPAKPAIPESLVVSATGKKPACVGDFSWGNLDPADGFPITSSDDSRMVTKGDLSYKVGKWEKITAGPQKYCFTATNLTAL